VGRRLELLDDVDRAVDVATFLFELGRAAQVSGFTVLASVLAFGALFGLIGRSSAYQSQPVSRSSRKSSPPGEELASPPQTLRSSSRRPNDQSVSARKVGPASPHWHDELSSERC
jgi:hypothetical protein